MGRHLSVHVGTGLIVSIMLCANAFHLYDYSMEHTCQVANGLEPNYDDSEECSSYWLCEDYGATLQHCEGSDQFHFQYGICMTDEDVSCWLQMERYYHGQSHGQLSESEYLTTKTCDIAYGQEPNYYDEGCKSYWYCEAHQGTLHECPEGFQFDWGELDCVRDEEVFCESQLEQLYEQGIYQMLHQEDEEEEKEVTSNTHNGYDVNAHPGHISAVHNASPTRRHHLCDVERGLEPDRGSQTCQTFWYCASYRGALGRCSDGYLFHWADRECLKDSHVDCFRQRERGSGTRRHP